MIIHDITTIRTYSGVLGYSDSDHDKRNRKKKVNQFTKLFISFFRNFEKWSSPNRY